MSDKQLNVWIPEELRSYVSQRADHEGRGMNAVIADLIRQDIARHQEDRLEAHALPVLRELIAAELRQTHAQLRKDLREDRQYEADRLLEFLKRQFDRLAGLIINAIRNASMTRRLTYTMLSKAYGSAFAKSAYDDAKEKAHRELLPKQRTVDGHVTAVDEQALS